MTQRQIFLALHFDEPRGGALEFEGAADVATVAKLCRQYGAIECIEADDPAEGELLLEARRAALTALEQLGTTMIDDVCVPRSRLASAARRAGGRAPPPAATSVPSRKGPAARRNSLPPKRAPTPATNGSNPEPYHRPTPAPR